MARTPSTMLELGTSAPDFKLPDPEGRQISLADFADKSALLVMFICNHCPFVKHIRGELANLGKTYSEKGVGIVAINSNDVANYPDDSPANMAKEIAEPAMSSHISTMRHRRWPRPITRPARRTFSCSMAIASWLTAANWTTVGRAMIFP
jgi:thiol-disulfide isomerase/thioredoxin